MIIFLVIYGLFLNFFGLVLGINEGILLNMTKLIDLTIWLNWAPFCLSFSDGDLDICDLVRVYFVVYKVLMFRVLIFGFLLHNQVLLSRNLARV